jgi:preprotein translocase subunit SecF
VTGSASPTGTASSTGTATPTPSGTASPPVITTASPPSVQSLVGNQVREALATTAGISADNIDEQDVGPTWGSQISAKAFQGLLIFLVLVSVYISLRFEPKMAGAALIALAHDLIITAGIYALVGREVTPAAVIAILTILGYSLYDTVVIFDKIKENTDNPALIARDTYGGVVNMSLNQTLMRSVNTSLVVLLPIGALLLFGGSTLKDFAFALFVGVASGTYSSIFVASPILVVFKESEPRYQQLRARQELRVSRQAPRATPKSTQRAVAGNGAGAPTGTVTPGGIGTGAPAAPKQTTGSSTSPSRPQSGQGGQGGASTKKKTSGKPKPKRRRR